MSAFLVFSTAPNKAAALRLIHPLLQKRLAACAHIGAPGESHYWWKGHLEKTREVTIIFKTTKKALPSLLRTIKQTHPYETPEILAVRVDCGNASYLAWLQREILPDKSSE